MIRLLVFLLLVACMFCLTAMRAEAAEGRLFRAALRPVRVVNQVRVNRLEARAERGNNLAAARLSNTQGRVRARCCY